MSLWTTDPRKLLRAGDDFDFDAFDTSATPGFDGDKDEGEDLTKERGELLSELQERLYAEGRAGGTRSVLCVVQGLDTAGKGGVGRHVIGMVDPQGVSLRSFGRPTDEELSHHFLWRIRKALPKPGMIGVFDRSHYEDVLVQRVDEIVPEKVWRRRYEEINEFEEELIEGGMTILKFALWISSDEQAERLMARLDRPDKRWKYSPGDLKTRAKWEDYHEAYADVFRFTSTEAAPWYVIPADRKWYTRLSIAEILTRTLVEMHLQWPEVDLDVEGQRAQLAGSMSTKSLERSLEETREEVQEAIESSIEIREESLELHPDDHECRENAKRKREEWEADLERTIKQKEHLIRARKNFS